MQSWTLEDDLSLIAPLLSPICHKPPCPNNPIPSEQRDSGGLSGLSHLCWQPIPTDTLLVSAGDP